MIYSHEVELMCPVAKGAKHEPAPIPEEGKWCLFLTLLYQSHTGQSLLNRTPSTIGKLRELILCKVATQQSHGSLYFIVPDFRTFYFNERSRKRQIYVLPFHPNIFQLTQINAGLDLRRYRFRGSRDESFSLFGGCVEKHFCNAEGYFGNGKG